MQIKISLEYFTQPGETLFMKLGDKKIMEMEYVMEGTWMASFRAPASAKSIVYGFEVRRDGKCLRQEWELHKIDLPTSLRGIKEIIVRDSWHERPAESPFLSKAFTDVIFRRTVSVEQEQKAGNLIFLFLDSQVRSDEVLALAGGGDAFGNWKKFFLMSDASFPYWSLCLDVSEPLEYKFVVLDKETLTPKRWEKGPNYFLAEVPSKGSLLIIRNRPPRFDRVPWRGAGTAIPVFSLRSEDSFGVGEFRDLEKLADWAAQTGQSVLQLLPINDTTMTGTWTDSYPYNANSTFALHPQFLHLPDVGVKADKEYLSLRQELNALQTVDYERVNREKTRLLKAVFKKNGRQVLSSEAYQAFLRENEHWLLPYAAFCVLRDENGTAEFGKWKELSEYNREKVAAFCVARRPEVDFHCYVQYFLDKQLKEAVQYAHSKGVAIKGDLPIGISRTSVDAWQWPKLFNLDSQAGAPPDAFSTDGQNWGFPTYNWEEMAKDGYAWWKSRLGKMSEYFDAFRIDHILGFFRIWEIPLGIQSGLLGHFNPALPYSADEIRGRGFDPDSELFVPDPRRKGWHHPRIGSQQTGDYKSLNDALKQEYNGLYDDFFYRRHNVFWKDTAMKKLPALLDSTKMLACGEDLGMIPDCVPETMQELHILSLEIQRMPKSPEKLFGDPASYPYLSVCATSTHDTSSLRGWWEEDRGLTERFYREMLHGEGEAPRNCDPWICERILVQHLQAPSMLMIVPLQDWTSIDETVRYPGDPQDERINIPANPRHYWRWRMHFTLEDLLSKTAFNDRLGNMIRESGRGI